MHDVAQPPITHGQVRLAATAGANLVLDEVHLRKANAEWSGPVMRDEGGVEVGVKYATSWLITPDNQTVVVTLRAVATGRPAEGEKGRRQVWAKIDVALELLYRLLVPPPPEEVRNEFFDAFAAVNGPLNGWPYVREFMDSSARRMGLSHGTIPLFRIPKLTPPKPAEHVAQRVAAATATE